MKTNYLTCRLLNDPINTKIPALLSSTEHQQVTAWRKEGSLGGSLSWALTQQPLGAFPSPDQPRRVPPKMQYLKAIVPASFLIQINQHGAGELAQ